VQKVVINDAFCWLVFTIQDVFNMWLCGKILDNMRDANIIFTNGNYYCRF